MRWQSYSCEPGRHKSRSLKTRSAGECVSTVPLVSDTALIPVVSIVGSTGVGKTALAIQIGEALDGEIISADSRQIYRLMDIGTAKPTSAEQARVRHHLIDVVSPSETLGVAEYQRAALAAIAEVAGRGKLPLLVGGTGQYITATLEGWRIPEVPPDEALRTVLSVEAERDGGESLYTRLLALDPGAAGLIDRRNIRRVIRALEVTLATGEPFSEQRRRDPPPFRVMELGLQLDRTLLDSRLDARIDMMLDNGLVAEVQNLLDMGFDRRLPAMSGLGYADLSAYLCGEKTYSEAVELFKRSTRTFARRQMTWFTRHGTPRWIDLTNATQSDPATVIETIRRWRKEHP